MLDLDYNLKSSNLKMDDCERELIDIFEPSLSELNNDKLLIDDIDML